ncbi:MAG TPA: DUF2243 domain-containing protein [Solirubrobacteraceae bacterium]|nr:DUF2243 domain-containing protein [Solirubrobacteraceae bacterium]
MATTTPSGSPTARPGLRARAAGEERRANVAGILLGIGFGGFLDGILLHQILQWHHMLTSDGRHPATTVLGLEANTLADGLFHAATWLAALAGLLLLTSAMRRGYHLAARHLIGLVLAGWGAFNLVEGTVDHHLLGIHHVRTGAGQWAYDLGFLVLGAALLAGGLLLARRAEPDSRRASA